MLKPRNDHQKSMDKSQEVKMDGRRVSMAYKETSQIKSRQRNCNGDQQETDRQTDTRQIDRQTDTRHKPTTEMSDERDASVPVDFDVISPQ
jgi:hypothetical protein